MALRLSDEEYEEALPELNPGQDYYDQEFNNLNKREQTGSEKNVYNDDGSKPESLENTEQNPNEEWKNDFSKQGSKGQLKAKGRANPLKNKGPLTAIILTLAGGSIGIGALLSPGLLIVHLKEMMVNKFSQSTSALQIRTNKVLYAKFKNIKNGFTFSSDGKCNIRCKFGTVSSGVIDNFKARGFKVEVTEGKGVFGTRYTINKLTFPNGDFAEDGATFQKLINKSKNATAFRKVFNSKTAFFLNTKFGSMLKEKFGLNKISNLKNIVVEKGKTKAQSALNAVREALGLSKITDFANAKLISLTDKIKSSPAYESVSTKLNSLKDVGTNLKNAAAAICAVNGIGRGITYAIKAAKLASFAGFAMLFLKVADQIKAGDSPDPDAISQLGSQLTTLDENGQTATDSLGYKMAANNNYGSFTDPEKKYTPILQGDIVTNVAGFLAGAGVVTGVGLHALRDLCIGLNSDLATAIECATTAGEGAVAGTVVPVLGNAVGFIAGLLACAATNKITTWAIGATAGILIGNIITSLANGYLVPLDETTVGGNAGNAITTGSAQILGGTSASYGLKPASSTADINQYVADTYKIQQQDQQIAYEEARNTPFDIYNQYSFLGSIVRSTGLVNLANSSPILSAISNFGSIIPRSFASLLPSSAMADQSTIDKEYGAGQCNDQALKDIGVVADSMCNPYYVMSNDALNTEVTGEENDAVLNYMINDNGGYIDQDTGEAKPNTEYQNYLDYCVNRTIPLGETDGAIEDSNFFWKTGLYCTKPDNPEQLKNFQVYTMDKSINDTLDESDQNQSAFNMSSDDIAFYSDANNSTEDVASAQAYSDIEDILSQINDSYDATTQPSEQTLGEVPLVKEQSLADLSSTNICKMNNIINRATDFGDLCGYSNFRSAETSGGRL